ncbi:serine/threonine protein kinase [Agrobacterium sp. a22-2]|nr:serine/threonine-protein kinase [Agrobacterium sp. a22-2]NKN37372.1 serine/threonine protein kinase [Agrobacterium sp. a22-2]
MSDDVESGLDEISERFSALWKALLHDGSHLRQIETRAILLDRVRDALDRGESRLTTRSTEIIANTFTLEELVHDGAVTQVFRARHRDLGTQHAIKVLRADQAHDPIARRLLLREAEVGVLLRHPQILATQTLLRLADGRPALVLEWFGCTLSDCVAQRQLSVGDITGIMISVLSGLAAIHERHLVHCDLSPSNLLCDGSDFLSLKIADFGIAMEAGRRHGELDLAFAGQPAFAAPEQIAGRPVDGRTDLHAAGRLLLLLLNHCDGPVGAAPRLSAFGHELSARNPDERPKNAKAALLALRGLPLESKPA